MNETEWEFDDEPNTAVIANRKIISDGQWIAYVSHDSDDGIWQFHTSQTELLREENATVVSLQNIIMIDHSIAYLADLPRGWCAWRNSVNDPWEKYKLAK